MSNKIGFYFTLVIIFCPLILFGQVLITPKISTTHNYYYWNSNPTIEDVQKWTCGIGAAARLPLSKKLYGQFSFNVYPFGLRLKDERKDFHDPDFVVTTYTDIFDIKLGLDYKLYPNTLLGVGIEMEQYFNSISTFSLSSLEDIPYVNQKYFGFELSLTQWLKKIEIFANVFIGLHEGGVASYPSLSNGKLVFFSHKKLELGIGFPIGKR
jgi:hypothetical protein